MPSPVSQVMIVAGERSGDIYGAGLARALRARVPGLEVFGCGGEAMSQAAVDTIVDSHQITMVGITEVVSGIPRVYRAFRRLLQEVDRRQPQLAVLIDFPDFNLRLARQLKKRRIPVVYFVSPQVWAWRMGRVKKLKKRIAKMIVIFDFEEEIYKQAGVPVEYVGHPLVDMVRPHLTREEFCAKVGLDASLPTIALLPGSRQKEVTANLPVMLDAATRLTLNRKLQFVLAVAPTIDLRWLETTLLECYVGRATVRTAVHATYDALQHSEVAVVASGTATLEAAIRERPMVVVYRVSALTYLVGKLLVKVPYYSMVNILANKELVPELIQHDFTAANVAARVEYLLDHPEAREVMIRGFQALRPRLGQGGAIERAADAVVGVLQSSQTTWKAG
ncbi:MAG TPA: lipid-A-disaccharide synthase [Terriglobia bacterium]|nr:lipid-A-disaccharide synthase [Terriglobia bacterium]